MESIEVGQMLINIESNATLEKRVHLPSAGAVVNLYSSILVNFRGEQKAIQKAVTNDRMERVRPEAQFKSDGVDLVLSERDPSDSFTKKNGAYGIEWAIRVKNDKKGLTIYEHSMPSFIEIVAGIINWNLDQVKTIMKDATEQEQMKIVSVRSQSFDRLRMNVRI